jgi:hypothetical protein
MRGLVLIAGRPVDRALSRCMVRVSRLPTALEDIPGGLSAGARTTCLPDGNFELLGLKAGGYMLKVETSAGDATVPDLQVQDEITDAGTIDIGSGGKIEGVVLDGVTGEGAPGQAVFAYSGSGEEFRGVGEAVSGTEGRFSITGLSEGVYEVLLLSRPFHTTTVDVVEGASDPVELTTGDASLVKDNGFSIETDDEGFLVVSAVDGNGSAAANGLEAGDTVVGVSMGGVNLNEIVPGMSEEITDAVLDHWGGPGVSLLVDRDGTEVVVSMD